MGCKVTKPTGEKIYLLKDRVIVVGADFELRTEGTRYLCPVEASGNITAIPGDQILKWETTEEELLNFLSERQEKHYAH